MGFGGFAGGMLDHVCAMKRLFIFLAFLLVGQAWASFPATATAASASCWAVTCTYGHINNVGTEMGWYSTYEAAKAAVAAGYTGTNAINSWADPGAPAAGTHYITTYARYGTGNWLATSTVLSKPVAGSPQATTTYSCPANSTVSGSSCSCNTGYVQSGSSCVDPNIAKCQAQTGTLAGNFQAPYSGGGLGGNYSYLCDGGCTVNVAYDFAAAGLKMGAGRFTGSTCNGDPSSLGTSDGSVPTAGGTGTENPIQPGAPARTPCKSTEYAGEINGVWTCVKPSPGSTQTAKPTTGSTTSTNANGEQVKTTTDKQTTCTAGTCTTTTTTTITNLTTGATSTGTQTDTQDQKSFCDANPSLSICRESKYSSAGCDAPAACDGDAIQCAIAELSRKTACALDPKDNGELAAFDAAKAVTGSVIGSLPGNATVAIGSASFNTTETLTGSCISDRSITVFGKSITVPFSGVCPYLVILGNIMVTVSLLGAAVIVFKG